MIGLILVFGVVGSALCQLGDLDSLDPFDKITELEFEEHFNVDHVNDTVQEGKREEALKENEELVHKINEEFVKGKSSWSAEVNKFSNLPRDEFLAMETGDIEPPVHYARGLLHPDKDEMVDQKSEDYFNQILMNRAYLPSYYSSVDRGLVSPVKSQGQCGSCVAFSNVAVVETCFKKLTGEFGDYSEQQMVDCGYGNYGSDGCNGAYADSYLKWATVSKADLVHEYSYPYLNTAPKLRCPANIPAYNQGAKVATLYRTYFSGTEDLMKQLVYTHGAVTTTVNTDGGFQSYKQGVFDGCISQAQDHAVTVVGYGTENGVDYWLIKNSWGTNWGDKGFIKLKRGVRMCGIAKDVATVTCTKVGGDISETPTTQKPCIDKYSNCGDHAVNSCYLDWMKTSCKKSCGLCAGMTPAASNTCYDKFSNCGSYLAYCTSHEQVKTACKKTCRTC